MTHSEFDHLLGSINSLSPEQIRQLRYELDTRLAPATAGDRQAAEQVSMDMQRQLLEAGIIGEVRPPITDLAPYRNRKAVPIQGEPISETVINERALSGDLLSGHQRCHQAVCPGNRHELGAGADAADRADSHFVARITWVETISAVTRRERGGNLAPPDAVTAITDFQLDFGRQYMPVEISAALIAHAGSLARQYALRGYDAVQLAAALEVRSRIPGADPGIGRCRVECRRDRRRIAGGRPERASVIG